MKKLLSMIAAMVMVLALGVTAYAADTGSITITNATVGQEYKVYRIFDATIKKNALGETEGVAYSIQKSNQFFEELFGSDGKKVNTYFVYDSATGIVTKKDGVEDSKLTEYLGDLVQAGSFTTEGAPITAGSATVKFDPLPFGYYVIERTGASVVTINSNAPDVEVIDKNQKPGESFSKKVVVGEDAHGNPIYGDENSANISDLVDYKVSFQATNYDGERKIEYYQVHDEKGEGIWVEFNDIQVSVGGTVLGKGYYLCEGDPSVLNTEPWQFLGSSWTGNMNDADWYLIHTGYNQFRIMIPWLEGHEVVEITDALGNIVTYGLKYPENAASKFTSPVNVDVTYSASIEADATIGGGLGTNLYNTAKVSWTSKNYTQTTPPDTVETKVYGIGITKTDISTGANLAGAEFRIYKDKECTQPVYVIPSNIDGVYRVDSLNTPGESISGDKTLTSREMVTDLRLKAYLGDDYKITGKQDNLVVSQVNGKLVILGLEAGKYYLKEVKAPDGYNALSEPVEIEAGLDPADFIVYADPSTGKVADLQISDGKYMSNVFQLTSKVVTNGKGVQLPTTGGFGRTAIIATGSLVAIGFAVLLITNKKMSIYTD